MFVHPQMIGIRRDAPLTGQNGFRPAPVHAISFGQPQSGGFVFGARQHDTSEPPNNSVAMDS
jgi:hypothetical protein